MKRALGVIAASLAMVLSVGAASAQHKIKIGCTATSDCVSAMVATDEGIFQKHGIEAEMVRIGINSNIPAAILSNSIQVGGPTTTVFLQAVDGGLPLVALAGASVMSARTNPNVAVFVRNGLTITSPQDFVGKKVGAPGLGAYLHVLFVKWLMDKGVDPNKVNFVEVTFPTMPDVMRSQAVDAVVSSEPTVTRMTNAGVGKVAFRYAAELDRKEPVIIYAASKTWAEQNKQAVAAFRAAIAEGAVIANSDEDKAVAAVAKFTGQQVDLVRSVTRNLADPNLKPENMLWWIDVMKQQHLLQGTPDVKTLIFP
ncbi:ABC transporter substrate-binding protein [Aquabacter sp. L1I39]|uniref:ABC transporter substrate-binding protein n=1 Tax=Aquabacter sp. L1I39 TaxID=2820278 RepID=UPI001ADD4FB1|nr:ABC transporter substrate-binding protein [Aquabacter sp. L1I39]QTL04716.1 ABC transporter substrate-binding protein [Aquabacter sp. L1I39]